MAPHASRFAAQGCRVQAPFRVAGAACCTSLLTAERAVPASAAEAQIMLCHAEAPWAVS